MRRVVVLWPKQNIYRHSNGPRGQTAVLLGPGMAPHCHSPGTDTSYGFRLSPVSAARGWLCLRLFEWHILFHDL